MIKTMIKIIDFNQTIKIVTTLAYTKLYQVMLEVIEESLCAHNIINADTTKSGIAQPSARELLAKQSTGGKRSRTQEDSLLNFLTEL